MTDLTACVREMFANLNLDDVLTALATPAEPTLNIVGRPERSRVSASAASTSTTTQPR